jgi:myo-inositol-1(or 4)-monophosphatase
MSFFLIVMRFFLIVTICSLLTDTISLSLFVLGRGTHGSAFAPVVGVARRSAWTNIRPRSLLPSTPISSSADGPTTTTTTVSTTTTTTKATHLDAWKTDLTLQDCQNLLSTAERAARAAGAIITAHSGCGSNNNKTEPQQQQQQQDMVLEKFNLKDIVTKYDKQAQEAIETIVRHDFPTHSFLGEENVASGGAASELALVQALEATTTGFVWICDPIDGTANFASGLPLSAVTMSVVYQGTPVVGVVYDPHAEELYSAIRGYGATLNGRPIMTTTIRSDSGGVISSSSNVIKNAIINAGCPADPNAFAASMRGVWALNAKCRGIRIIACSALTTAWIASGRLTAHFGYDLSSWDLVAGALLIQEAGGTVTELDGSAYRLETRNMLCSNGSVELHDEILSILKAANAVSFTRTTTV